jgi:hypothetical protein
MKKILIIIVVFLFTTADIYAKKVDEATARTVGLNFFTKKINSPAFKKITDLELIYKGTDGKSNVTYYIFNASKDGFVIISGDDVVNPILAYSDEGSFDPNNLSPAIKEWLENYSSQISYAIEQKYNSALDINSEWERYMTGNLTCDDAKGIVGPLIKTFWDQGEGYNNKCPADTAGPGNHCYAGCVAVAMGQIMYYWQWPIKGLGSHSYTCSPYGTLSANFGNTTYNWSIYEGGAPLILYHCGVSVDMVYTPDASGSSTEKVINAFSNYFYYCNAQYVHKSSYTDAQWVSLLKAELDAGRPIQYTGSYKDQMGYFHGHSFDCDGYNSSTGLFHINWGWGGECDGYFTISNLVVTHNGLLQNYIYDQGAAIHIQPTKITGPDVICSSSQFQLSGYGLSGTFTWKLTNGNGWTFSNGSTSITGSSLTSVTIIPGPSAGAGSPTITVTGGNLCCAISKNFIIKTIPATPGIITISPSSPSYCKLDSRSFSVIPVASATLYNWTYTPINSGLDIEKTNTNGNTVSVTFIKTGTYTVKVAAGNECGLSAYNTGKTFLVNSCVTFNSLNETSEYSEAVNEKVLSADSNEGDDIQFSVFPNPADNKIEISLPEEAEIEILNIEGQIMKRINAEKTVFSVDISDYAKGMYFVKIKTEDGVRVKKFIKE